MVLQDVGKINGIVVAHPDDETLWAGGLPIRFKDKNWTVICCSIPKADPIRAEKFKDACKVLGVNFILCDTPEDYFHPPKLELEFDTIFTHNVNGDYGHVHHKLIHDWVCDFAKGDVYTFLGSEYQIHLTGPEASQKLQALQCYDHKSPHDEKVKWAALLDRYFQERRFDVEGYDRV